VKGAFETWVPVYYRQNILLSKKNWTHKAQKKAGRLAKEFLSALRQTFKLYSCDESQAPINHGLRIRFDEWSEK
jgi:hypothetical protein